MEEEFGSNSGILLYPNHVSEILFIEGLPAHATNYRIFSLNGQLVRQGEIPTDASVEVSSLAAGMYFLSIETRSGEVFYAKFLKQLP